LALSLGKRIVVVAAHPDDEALGCGGALARAAREGAETHVVFLADGEGARAKTDGVTERERAERRAASAEAGRILGVKSVEHFDFPDNAMDAVPLLDVVRAVEGALARLKPDTVITHHAGDLNVDHRIAHAAVLTSCRPQPGHFVERILCFEVPSSTDWQVPGSAPAFAPNLFIDISRDWPGKRRALEAYGREMRPWPHARSLEAVEHLTRWRGATVGCEAAEAFVVARHVLRSA
jgi:LmbE family N-acetylglucosaminyl deacetylase